MNLELALLFLLAATQAPPPITTCNLADPTADAICVLAVNQWGYTQSAAQLYATAGQGVGVAASIQAAIINALRNQQNQDEQKEAADKAELQTSIANALAAALAKDATSLQVCPTGQVCSFTIPACDISGVFGADPIHGPTQPSIVGCKAGWMMPGEKLYYTQYVPLAGLYTFSVSVASVATSSCPDPQKGNFHLEIAGVPIFPADGSSVPVPRTATWSSYQTLVLGQVQLTGGVIKFAFVNDSTVPSCFDLSQLTFSK